MSPGSAASRILEYAVQGTILGCYSAVSAVSAPGSSDQRRIAQPSFSLRGNKNDGEAANRHKPSTGERHVEEWLNRA